MIFFRPSSANRGVVVGSKVLRIATTASFVSALVLFFATSNASSGGPNAPFDVIDVYVSCSCYDPVGSNLCAALTTRIKRSTSFRYVNNERDTGGIGARLQCIAAGGPHATAIQSFVAVAIVTFAGDLEYFDTLNTMEIGSRQVDASTTSIVSAIHEAARKSGWLSSFDDGDLR